MNKKEEKEYYSYLEKVIREQKSKTPFFSKGSESYELDLLVLLNHIIKTNKGLADKIVDNFIDTTVFDKVSKQDILNFMAKTEKGTIARWKDEDGKELYLFNNGKSINNRKKILVFGDHLNKKDLEMLKKSIFGSVLRKDIERVYESIAKRNNGKSPVRNKNLFNVPSDLSNSNYPGIFDRNPEIVVKHTSSDFERNFKELVKEQGASCIPFSLASTIISFMNNHERKHLAESLTSRGIRDDFDLERLLSKWKNEALAPFQSVKNKRSKNIGYERNF